MENALIVLTYYARNNWTITIVLGLIFLVGIVASVMTFRYGKRNPRNENLATWKVYPITALALLFFALYLFDETIPTQEVAEEESIAVVEGLYVKRPSGGRWGGIDIMVQLEDGAIRRFSTPGSFPMEDRYYHTVEQFPEVSTPPQKVRVYYLENNGKALCMEVIG